MTATAKHVREMYTPLNPTFIKKNWGLQGYTYFFLIFAPKQDCGYPQSVLAKIRKKKKIKFKNLCILHRHVFVMVKANLCGTWSSDMVILL